MQDSFKSTLLGITVMLCFMICIIGFITLYPYEHGAVFPDAEGQQGYLKMNQLGDLGTSGNLTYIKNSTSSSFNEWDITQGFMGSNSLKQGSNFNLFSIMDVLFNGLTTMIKTVFGSDSAQPVLIIFGIIVTALTIWATVLIIKFLRSGN